MIVIRPLDSFDPARFQAIASGYTTSALYRVTRSDSEAEISFTLTLQALPEPREFRFPFVEEELERYGALVPSEYCFGAFEDATLAGIALAEPQEWNRTLWVWDFHVAASHRGQGIGRRLMAALAERAAVAGLRAIICETQNTNVPAIRFYRAVGFTMEGVDISYYTNEDMHPGGTVAVFMKLRLE